MKLKTLAFLSLFAVAACEAPQNDSGSSTGTGTGGAGYGSGYESSTVAPSTLNDFEANVSDRVFFALNSSGLNGEAQAVLQGQAEWLKANPAISVIIEGHADERGTREYNLALGERRANAVRNYLISLGVAAGRVDTVSYGKERPAVLGSNESAWAQNRRGVTVLGN